MVKAKRKTKRGKGSDGALETLLRFEIVVALFSLIGLYYFLSFSPIRMPAEPLASPPQKIAPLPPQPEPQVKAAVEVEKPPAESDSAQGAVVAELPAAPPLVASVSSADGKTDSPSGESAMIAEPGVSDSVAEPGEPVLEKTKLPEPSAVPARNEPKPAVAPAPAVVAESGITAPQPVPATPVKKPQPQPLALPPRTIVAGDYVLQVNALKNRHKLESLNFTVKSETVLQSTPMYRVYLGTFPQQKKALEIMSIVRKKGDDPFLQAVSGGYNVVIGSFYLRNSVIAWENMYHAAGFEPKVQEITLQMPHTLLLVDGPEVQQDTDAVLARLQASGFPDSHLK